MTLPGTVESDPKRRRFRFYLWTLLLLTAVLALLLGWLVFFVDTFWGRFALGLSTIAVVNDASVPLEDLQLVTFDSRGEHVRSAGQLAPGERLAVKVRTTDLYLKQLTFTINGRTAQYDQGGIACPGEVFVIAVKGPGEFETYY